LWDQRRACSSSWSLASVTTPSDCARLVN
jgi:hypothetical protein